MDATWTVISPHLDDAVFSCGQWLAEHPGSVVVTVFAGLPAATPTPTEWDARCGFASGTDAVATRRAEDHRALALLGAQPLWLEFEDSQYGSETDKRDIAATLRDILWTRDQERVLIPLGLFHTDHYLAHESAIVALRALGARCALAYEDSLYRGIPGLLQERLAALLSNGRQATPARDQAHVCGPLKNQAVLAYASQLRAFGPNGFTDTRRPERIWRI